MIKHPPDFINSKLTGVSFNNSRLANPLVFFVNMISTVYCTLNLSMEFNPISYNNSLPLSELLLDYISTGVHHESCLIKIVFLIIEHSPCLKKIVLQY